MSARIEISRRILLINFFSAGARRIISLTVLFWLFQHLIDRVPDEEYELYPVLLALMMFFQLATPIFASGLRRYITEAYARGDETRVTQLVSTMAPILAVVAACVLGLGLLVARYIDSVLTIAPSQVESAQLMFELLVLSASLQLAAVPFGMGFHVRQKFLAKNLIGLGAEVLKTALLLYLLNAFGTKVQWVIVAMVIANVTELAVDTVVSMRLVPALRYRVGEFRRDLIQPLMAFGLWAVLGRIAFLIRDAADNLILNKLATPTDVTAFHQGSLVDTHIRRTYLQAASTGQPAVTAMHATDQKWRMRRTYFLACRYSLWIMLALAVPLILYRHEFFELYQKNRYEELQAAATVMGLLLARAVFIFPNSILGMVTVATAQMRAMAWRSCLISIANLATTIYLVGGLGMGAIGSALGTFIVTAIGAPTLNWTLGLKLCGAKVLPWLRSSVWPGVLPALVAAPAWYGVGLLCPPDSWVRFAIVGVSGLAVYVGAVFAFAMRPEDRRDVVEVLTGLKAALLKSTRPTP